MLRDPRPYVATAAIVPLAILAYGLIRLMSKAKELEPRLEVGAFGTILGLICALVGSRSLTPVAGNAARPGPATAATPIPAIPAETEVATGPGEFCAACHAPVAPGARFCNNCGEKLG